MRVAILGTRGIPACYSGFETLAEELGARLVARGHEVTVYTRRHMATPGLREHRGVRIQVLPAWRAKTVETISHTALSCLHASRRRFDVVLLCNAANAPLITLLHARGLPVLLNVDGLERKRRKWSRLGQAYYRWCERLAVRWADTLLTDAAVMRRYYRRAWGRDSIMIPYGGDLEPPASGAALERFGLRPGGYLLYVARFEPENNPDRVAAAYRGVPGSTPLVMVGGAPYAPALVQRVRSLAAADPRIVLTGFVYGEGYRELLFGAAAYIQATEVGGTHPALVEAMGAGRVVFFLDNPPNREVVGGVGVPFRFDAEPSLTSQLAAFLADPARFAARGAAARARVLERYRWDDVAAAYERALEELCRKA
ncbi:MAG TPA: glycosyltransferase [Thermoanaerobaculaceae bacterium]|nr:glycosyltransferase [Thermoanaerobaculaceae bacterium]HRS17598.1 glycosyltransferase [Thermoanaerobaculaceae bacterium]